MTSDSIPFIYFRIAQLTANLEMADENQQHLSEELER